MTDQSQPTIDQLTARLDRVEKDNRVQRWLTVFAIAIASFAILLGQGVLDKNRTISAGALLLRNADGNVVASLSGGNQGRPYLSLNNSQGNIAASLSVGSDDRPTLTFADENKALRGVLGLKANGAPFMTFVDAPNVPRLTLTADGSSSIVLADPSKVVRWSISVDGGGARLKSFDASGKEVP